MKRALYFFDKTYFSASLRVYNGLLNHLNQLAESYSSMGLKQPFDKKFMLAAINNPANWIAGIKNELLITLELANTPEFIRRKFIGEIENEMEQLKQKATAIIDEYLRLSSSAYNYNVDVDFDLYGFDKNGTIVLPDESEQIIKDRCSVWIENESQKQAVSIMDEVNAQIEKLDGILKGKGIEDKILNENNDNSIFRVINERYQIKHTIIQRIK